MTASRNLKEYLHIEVSLLLLLLELLITLISLLDYERHVVHLLSHPSQQPDNL